MRNEFISELTLLARADSRIMLMVGDLGYSVVEPFAEEFPNQFLNVGIAEQNLIGAAAGIASEGYKVFAYSIANFPTFRAAEQFRNDVDYHDLGVTVVSVGGGLGYGNLGYSHHAIQDYGLMRLFPKTTIYSPGYPSEVQHCTRLAAESSGPGYLRLDKSSRVLSVATQVPPTPGVWNYLGGNRHSRKAVVSTGGGLSAAISFVGKFETSEFALFTLPIWGMGLKKIQSSQLEDFDEVHTFEDHLFDGGFGSWMLETSAQLNCKVTRIIPHALSTKVIDKVGSQSHLETEGGLIR